VGEDISCLIPRGRCDRLLSINVQIFSVPCSQTLSFLYPEYGTEGYFETLMCIYQTTRRHNNPTFDTHEKKKNRVTKLKYFLIVAANSKYF
jgi:hypothetical protein